MMAHGLQSPTIGLTSTFKAFLDEPEGSKDRALTANGNGIFLGFFNPGEGRLQLRQMILSWMAPELDEIVPGRCKSMLHSWKRNATLIKECDPAAPAYRQRILFHAWSLKWWRKCGLCLHDEGPSQVSVFDKDLIPGV